MIADILQPLLEHTDASRYLTPPVRPVLMTGGPGSKRLGLLLFGAGDKTPSLFVKMATSDDAREGLRREHRALLDVGRLPGVGPTVPDAVGVLDGSTSTALVQSAVTGTPMSATLQRVPAGAVARHRANIDEVLTWLRTFQVAGRGTRRRVVEADVLRSRLAEVLPSRSYGDFIGRTADEADWLAQRSVSLVRRHGDLWPGNVLVGGGSVSVVDWERSAPEHLPTDDVIMFLGTYAATHAGGSAAAEDGGLPFLDAWLGRDRLARVCSDALVAFGRPHGLDATDVRVLLVHFLLDRVEDPVGATSEQWRRMVRAYADGSSTLPRLTMSER